MKSYRIFDLKCEYLKSPNAICEAAPRFSFKIGSKGTEKYKLRLSIAKSEADLNCGNYIYDTDYAELDAPFILSAPKGILKPFSSYVWQIFLKSSGGEEAFSKIQSFETGVFFSYAFIIILFTFLSTLRNFSFVPPERLK